MHNSYISIDHAYLVHVFGCCHLIPLPSPGNEAMPHIVRWLQILVAILQRPMITNTVVNAGESATVRMCRLSHLHCITLTSCTSSSLLARHPHFWHVTLTSGTSRSLLAHHPHFWHITLTSGTSPSLLTHHPHFWHITLNSSTTPSQTAGHNLYPYFSLYTPYLVQSCDGHVPGM